MPVLRCLCLAVAAGTLLAGCSSSGSSSGSAASTVTTLGSAPPSGTGASGVPASTAPGSSIPGSGASGSAPPPSGAASSSGTPSGAAATSGSSSAASQAPVAAESNPPGDIPDNLAFVPYQNATGGYRFTHPEGWAQSVSGTSVTFTDKLNGVQVSVGAGGTAPSVSAAQTTDVPALRHSQPAFELRSVKAVSEPGGKGVLIVYRRNSAPDPVTGRQYRDEVQRYELAGGKGSVVVELFGPVGADNVDAYRTMIQSLRLS
jgi:hypothetical protein